MNTFSTDTQLESQQGRGGPSRFRRHCSRRRALELMGAGFGTIGLAALLGQTGALAAGSAGTDLADEVAHGVVEVAGHRAGDRAACCAAPAAAK